MTQTMLRALVLLLSLFATAPSRADASQPIPIDSFVREDEYAMPRLSPDGKYLAVTARLPRDDRFVPVIMVYALPEMKEMSATQLPRFEVAASYTWVSNTRLVVAKAKEFGSLEAPLLTGEVLAMDFDGANQEYLYGYKMNAESRRGRRYVDNFGYGYVEDASKKRDGHFYLTAHTFDTQQSMLYDINAGNGTRKLLAVIDHPDLRFVLQNDGTPRFAFGTDKAKNSMVLYRRDAAADKWTVVDEKDPAYGIGPFAFSADDKEVFALARGNGGPSVLVRQDMASGERVTVARDSVGSIAKFVSVSAHAMPVAAGTHIGVPTVQYIDANTPEALLHKRLSGKFPGQFVDFVNYTDDGAKLLFSVRSDREPGAYFLFDRNSGKAFPLFAQRQLIDPALMAERRPIRFAARDGLELHGYLTLPRRTDDKKPPLVLLPHGGPHGPSDKWFYDNDAQFLASRGYAVLQVNFRGSGGRGDAFETAGYRQWGGKIQDDLIDGVKWAIAGGLVDGGRVCSYGGSFGAYSALMVTVRAPDMFKCAIGYAGVYDLKLMYTGSEAASGGKRRRSVFADYIGEDVAELDRNSPASLAEKITVPVLLVHGEADERALFKHALVMRAALRAAGRDPEWMAVPGEGHGFYATGNRTAFYEKLEAFLAKNLK
jgi:dipeptidyl aminopeptidase/acylaminoacyl peptidase